VAHLIFVHLSNIGFRHNIGGGILELENNKEEQQREVNLRPAQLGKDKGV
jgi:hypothetical protein